MRQSGLPEGHSNAAVKQHGLLRRLTSRIGGGMDGKKRAKRCAKQRVEDFATRISQVLAANSAGTGAVGAQAPRFPDRAQREEARRQFSRSLRRKTERKEGTREQKHPWHPTPERTAIFFLSSYFSFPSTNQTHTQPPPICLSTRCASPTASKDPRRELPIAHSLHSTRPCPLTAQPLFVSIPN